MGQQEEMVKTGAKHLVRKLAIGNKVRPVFLGIYLSIAGLTSIAFSAPSKMFDTQFFGDVFIPKRVLEVTKKHPDGVFKNMKEILSRSEFNVVNLEAPLTNSFATQAQKTYLLKMPVNSSNLLKKLGVNVVNLANNHLMDHGNAGLIDTLNYLKDNEIGFFGAGVTQANASAPLILTTSSGVKLCLLGFSQTFPKSFWADQNKAGSNHGRFSTISFTVNNCVKNRAYPLVSFHWGRERERIPQKYQTKLAHLAIDSGALAVIGHHPHIVQTIEIYKNRPIFYSIGNFTFGTVTHNSPQEGLAVSFKVESNVLVSQIVPLDVDNRKVWFRPREKDRGTYNALKELSLKDPCWPSKKSLRVNCKFPLKPESLTGSNTHVKGTL